jgi:hypothetical protein
MNVYNKPFFCALVWSLKKVGASKVRVNKKCSSRNKYWKKVWVSATQRSQRVGVKSKIRGRKRSGVYGQKSCKQIDVKQGTRA